MFYPKHNSYSKIVLWKSIVIFQCLILLGCSFINFAIEPIGVSITELTSCRGIDESGNPLGISKIFSPEEERIYVYGYAQTNQPSQLDIYWYHEDELIYAESAENIQGSFFGFIQPREGQMFEEGSYKVEIRAYGTYGKSTEFRVKK